MSSRRNQRGVVFPSPVTILSIVAVAMAGVAWFATRPQGSTDHTVLPAAAHSPSAQQSPSHQPRHHRPHKPAVDRSRVLVDVFNNSAVSGLAGRVATRTSQLGWRVVGSDNWYGTIPASTVYYPPQLGKAGRQLALDLGIRRTMPSVSPMRLDRLTLILTGPLATADSTRGWVRPVRFTSSDAEQRYAALVAVADTVVVGLDFDGTLAPIVDDPDSATIHPDAGGVLLDLSTVVRAVAVVTGRPARKVLALGGLDEVGREIGESGRELFVFGQYGFERWSSTQRRVVSPRPPQGLSGFLRELPGVLRDAGAQDAFVEDKGLAIAVHTRRLRDPADAFGRLEPRLRDLAERHAMVVEPGRNVIEVRSPGMDKGAVVRTLAEETGAGGFLFAGDDLGDVEAFEAVSELREQGLATLLVCSASDEESALVDRSDVVVRGPEGVLDLLRRLTSDARQAR